MNFVTTDTIFGHLTKIIVIVTKIIVGLTKIIVMVTKIIGGLTKIIVMPEIDFGGEIPFKRFIENATETVFKKCEILSYLAIA